MQGDAEPPGSEKEKRISLLRVRKGRAAAVDEAAQAHEGALSQAQRAAEAESEAKRAAAEAKRSHDDALAAEQQLAELEVQLEETYASLKREQIAHQRDRDEIRARAAAAQRRLEYAESQAATARGAVEQGEAAALKAAQEEQRRATAALEESGRRAADAEQRIADASSLADELEAAVRGCKGSAAAARETAMLAQEEADAARAAAEQEEFAAKESARHAAAARGAAEAAEAAMEAAAARDAARAEAAACEVADLEARCARLEADAEARREALADIDEQARAAVRKAEQRVAERVAAAASRRQAESVQAILTGAMSERRALERAIQAAETRAQLAEREAEDIDDATRRTLAAIEAEIELAVERASAHSAAAAECDGQGQAVRLDANTRVRAAQVRAEKSERDAKAQGARDEAEARGATARVQAVALARDDLVREAELQTSNAQRQLATLQKIIEEAPIALHNQKVALLRAQGEHEIAILQLEHAEEAVAQLEAIDAAATTGSNGPKHTRGESTGMATQIRAPSVHEERWDTEIRDELRRVRDEFEWLEAELHGGKNSGAGGGSTNDGSHTSAYPTYSYKPHA